ncbi:MAG: hypothetical protein ACP5NW_00920 [Candidatus Woesearchaeota archaeon]
MIYIGCGGNMSRLINFLTENYFNMKRNNGYFRAKNLRNNSINNINRMSAVLTPEGIVTQQSPGESLEGLDERVDHLHPVYRSDIKGKFRLGEQIDSIYQNFINSGEGKEFIKYLKRTGNGTSKPGSIDDILVVNKGEGMVAATMPDLVRKNLIINEDYIDEYVNMATSTSGLSREQVIENILVHELHHIYGQKPSERRGKEIHIEYNNDISLVKFYTELAKKDVDNSDVYLTKAKLFTARYNGEYRKSMDSMIAKTQEQIYKSYANSNSRSYKQAA